MLRARYAMLLLRGTSQRLLSQIIIMGRKTIDRACASAIVPVAPVVVILVTVYLCQFLLFRGYRRPCSVVGGLHAKSFSVLAIDLVRFLVLGGLGMDW